MVNPAAGPMMAQPTPSTLSPSAQPAFSKHTPKTALPPRYLAKEAAIPFNGFLTESTTPPFKLVFENAPASEMKTSNLLVFESAMAGVVNVLFSQVPVFNRSFHKAGDHDKSQDKDVDAGEHFVHQGRFFHAES